MIRLLHTADIHLGRQFPFLGAKSGEYRNQLLRTFEKIVDLAISERVSLLLIAGDLFDTNRVVGLTISKVHSAFQKLEGYGIRVCIIPGTHDVYNADSLYRSLRFTPNVTVFTPERSWQNYEDLALTVYGMVSESKSWQKSPLSGLSLTDKSRFHVGMVHCSIDMGLAQNDGVPLGKDEVASSGLDYLALGHWHSFQEFSQGKTAACYSGSPEPIDMDQKGAGHVVMVTIKEGDKAELQPIQIGSKKCDSLTIDVSPFETITGVEKLIEARSDPNLILKVILTGLGKISYDLNTEKIETNLGGCFFNLRVDDKTHPELEAVKSQNYPEKTVTGRYLKIMEEKIAAAATPEDKSLYEEALKLGFALLQGRSEVIE